jgi:hypothetical protein
MGVNIVYMESTWSLDRIEALGRSMEPENISDVLGVEFGCSRFGSTENRPYQCFLEAEV